MQLEVCSLIACLAAVSLLKNCQVKAQDAQVDDQIGYVAPGTSAAELMRARGYLADTEHLVAADDYQLEIVRGRNPLFKRSALERGKLPIVFLHGILQTNLCWLVNSIGVRPRVYNESASNLTLHELIDLAREDPARRALPFLAMNFGYEVWLLSRRGFTAGSRRLVNRRNRTLIEALADLPGSFIGEGFTPTANLPLLRPERVPIASLTNVTHLNSTQIEHMQNLLDRLTTIGSMFAMSPLQILQTLTKLPQEIESIGGLSKLQRQFIDTFDTKFWSFSMDEQAEFDFPATIEHVLRRTGANKLHMVSFSVGGAVSLMGLALKPELGDKISKLVLYSPALNLGSRMGIDYMASFLVVPTQPYTGPVPFLFQVNAFESIFQQICNNDVTQVTLCESILDAVFGPTAGQERPPEYFFATAPEPTSSRELMQLGQFARFERPRMYDFNTKAKNVAKYGTSEPPVYDLGRITLRNMSIYVGRNDQVVAPNAVATTVSQLKVPVEVNLIGDKLIHFNHIGNQLHDYNDQLILLPTLLDIDRMNALEMGARSN